MSVSCCCSAFWPLLTARAGAKEAVASLQNDGVRSVVLTGDNEP